MSSTYHKTIIVGLPPERYSASMRCYPTLLVATCLLGPVAATAEAFVQPPAYKECTSLALRDPEAALVKAEAWLKIDDGFAAHHCRAMALYGLRQFVPAAEALSVVRGKILPDNIALRSYVARQSAKAWVSAGRIDAALASLSAQISEMSVGKFDNVTEARLSADLLLDRARLRRTYGQTAEAVQDLDHAITLTPLNEEVLLERALSFEQLRDVGLARQDAEAVLRLNPSHPQALELVKRLKR